MKFAIVIISTLSIRFFKEIILINIIFDISNNLQIFLPYSRSPATFLSPILKNSNIYRCKISKPVKRFEKIQSVIFVDKKLEYCENRWSRDARVGNFSNIAAQISLHRYHEQRERENFEKNGIFFRKLFETLLIIVRDSTPFCNCR